MVILGFLNFITIDILGQTVLVSGKGLFCEFFLFIFYFFFAFFCLFSGLHPWHMEVPRLGVQLELQLPAYAIATAIAR